MELLHQSCQLQHQILLEKYGGDKDLSKVRTFFNSNHVEPNSKDGYRLMKEAEKLPTYSTI
ncbi:hypothetical protein [Alkaliphilus sp. B6464]|uniref:hypothetical protein n=1 Tax=Alkaliphilus sp. B6464 TaxID=2731219 RepID=UPI001BAB89FB|nr:hypothetical protein [Alkaliphilus sp. B6464]QUH20558.1 hypothetical protein HYG84_12195 [Alkaliphilus sp. B6464]